MDVCGPLPHFLLNSEKYFLTIIVNFLRKVVVYPFKKSDIFKCFKRFQLCTERFLNSKIDVEITHDEFSKFLANQGIKAERMNVYSPEQNSVSKCFNYTATDAVKAMLNKSKLKQFCIHLE